MFLVFSNRNLRISFWHTFSALSWAFAVACAMSVRQVVFLTEGCTENCTIWGLRLIGGAFYLSYFLRLLDKSAPIRMLGAITTRVWYLPMICNNILVFSFVTGIAESDIFPTICNLHRNVLNMIWYCFYCLFSWFLLSRECAESCSALELEKCSIQGLLSGILQLLCLMARFARVRYLAVSEFLHEVCLNYYNTPSLCFTYLASKCQAVSCLKVYFQLWRQRTTWYLY